MAESSADGLSADGILTGSCAMDGIFSESFGGIYQVRQISPDQREAAREARELKTWEADTRGGTRTHTTEANGF